ncbi:hypothetical protein ASD00_19875 [Ensifer sp. Root31]|nr:hypothetical protein ASD00_19875 [Ensifer sp. Root31]
MLRLTIERADGEPSARFDCFPLLHQFDLTGRQELLNHGSSGPYRPRIMNQPLPGIVCTQLFSIPAGAFGPK